MLKSTCIKAVVGKEDGLSFSIMSRHTKNDGRTLDPDISLKSYDEWWRALAPNEKTLGLYLRGESSFDSLSECYRWKLFHDDAAYAAMLRLIELARSRNVTVLCVEDSPEYCHRKMLLEVCKRLEPELEVVIG